MLSQRNILRSLPGKEAELRSLLVDRVKARQAEGVDANLLTQLFAPEGPVSVVVYRWEDMAKLDQNRASPDPAYREFAAKVAGLVSAPVSTELFELIIRAPAGGTTKYVQRVIRRPALGKGPELRALMEKLVSHRQANGFRMGLAAQLFGADGAAFVTSNIYEDFTDYQRFRTFVQTDAGSRQLQAGLPSLMAPPMKEELLEVLV